MKSIGHSVLSIHPMFTDFSELPIMFSLSYYLGLLAADDVEASFVHYLNCKRVDLRSNSCPRADCSVASWRIYFLLKMTV
jgi:hypothetical protein